MMLIIKKNKPLLYCPKYYECGEIEASKLTMVANLNGLGLMTLATCNMKIYKQWASEDTSQMKWGENIFCGGIILS